MEAVGLSRTRQRLDGAQLALLAALLALAVVAWVSTEQRMGAMDAMPGMDLGSLGFFTTVWVVMMAAMMFPSAAPTVLMYDRLRTGHRKRGKGAPADATWLFVGGYLAVWTLAGLAAYGLFAFADSLSIGVLAWDRAGRWLAGGVIVAAAVYQLTPLKETCLVHCRSPMMFLAEHWRNGRAGALWVGAQHGAWCLGCCWALMAALFAVGVMSLAWMAVIAVLIAGEKLLPWPAGPRHAVAALMLALGLAVALVPGQVPGFSAPNSGAMGGGGGGSMHMMR